METINQMVVPQWYRDELSVALRHKIQQTDSNMEQFMTRISGDLDDAHEETHHRRCKVIVREERGDHRWFVPSLVRSTVIKDINDDAFFGSGYLPTNDILQEVHSTFARRKDEIIIRSAYGVNDTGEQGEVQVTLLEDQMLGVDYASSGSGTVTALTLDKLATVREIFEENRVIDANLISQGEKIIGLISPNQKKQLLDMQGLSDSQLSEVKALNEGSTSTALGIYWVVTLNVPRDKDGHDQCLFYVQSGLAFVPWPEVQIGIDRLPMRNYKTQIWSQQLFGAGRLDEKKFVLVKAVRNRGYL